MSLKRKLLPLLVLFVSVQAVGNDGYIIRKNQRTLEKIECVYSQIPPVRYCPPAHRWKNLPRTKKCLTEGGNLTVVMLGDSIVNDTSRSCWNLLIERDHPECKIEKITSVRGSTGCWWYKEPGRVQKFVLDHKPELVIIGGISQRGDIDSIRDVIGQIRDGSDADILLMTGAFGRVDPCENEQWKRISNPEHFSDYRKDMENLAREVGTAFLDMELAWAEYIRASGKDLQWFKRDPIHANERGEQILGHILAAYLTPDDSSKSFVLSEHGCGRATAYSEFNKIVTIGEKTHVSWLDSQDGKFLVRIRTLNRDTGRWSPTYTVGEAFDNHGGPSLTADSSGHLHIVYYPHHHPFRYRRSLRPNDASQWTQETQFGEKCTYSSMICMPDDTLVLVCRESSKQRWVVNMYRKPSGDTWQGPITILHGRAPSGYTRWQAALALNPNNKTIHMNFMLYEQALKKVGYAVGYLCSIDNGHTWGRSDGTPVDLPATPETIDVVAGARTADGRANFRTGNIALGPDGTPWLIYSRMDRQPFETWIARPDENGQWRRISLLSPIQEKWPDRAVKTHAGIAFSRDGRMYVTVTTVDKYVEVESAKWGHPSAEVALLVSDDPGQSFKVFGISSPDPSVSNWLPNLERRTGLRPVHIPALIYTHGLKGENNKQIMSNEVIWCNPATFLPSQ